MRHGTRILHERVSSLTARVNLAMSTLRLSAFILMLIGISVSGVSAYDDHVCYALFQKEEANAFLSSGTRSTPKECCLENNCESRRQLCYTEQYRSYILTNVAPRMNVRCDYGQAVDIAIAPLSWCPGHYRFSCKNACDVLGLPRCMNGGTCHSYQNGSYTCSCPSGYGGTICQIVLDLLHQSACDDDNTANVYGDITSYRCQCKQGFTGIHCTINVNECVSNPCHHGGTCIDQVNGYSCSCPRNFTGPNCEYDAFCIEEYAKYDSLMFLPSGERSTPRECCIPGQCEKQGSKCMTEQQRQYILGGDLCHQYNESTIDKPRSWCRELFITSRDCVDICIALGRRRCENGGTCYTGNGTFTCVCPPGYSGNTCQLVTDMLRYSPCSQTNTAMVYYGPFLHCQCKDGFTGPYCLTDIDDCAGVTCHNGGTCEDRVNGYHCRCTEDYTGTSCQIACLHIPISHCTPGHQRCEGTADNVMCTHCEDPTYLRDGRCHVCSDTVPDCIHHHCTFSTNTVCLECSHRFALTDNGTNCLVVPTPSSMTCDYQDHNRCYVFFRETVTWSQARDVCSTRHGRLFVPENQKVVNFIENYLEAMRVRFPNMVFWIGGYRTVANTETQWVEGVTTHVNRWAHGEPSDSFCVSVDGDQSFDWQARDCSQQNQYICEEAVPYESTIVG